MLEGSVSAELKQLRNKLLTTKTGSASVRSMRSSNTAKNDMAKDAKYNYLTLNFQLPLGHSEKESTDGFKLPILMPTELSNRQQRDDGSMMWISPKIFRKNQEVLR